MARLENHPAVGACVALLKTRQMNLPFGWYRPDDTKGMMVHHKLSQYQMSAIWLHALKEAKGKNVKLHCNEPALTAELAKMMISEGTTEATPSVRSAWAALYPKSPIEFLIRAARTVAKKVLGRRRAKRPAKAPHLVHKAPDLSDAQQVLAEYESLCRRESALIDQMRQIQSRKVAIVELVKVAKKFEAMRAKLGRSDKKRGQLG